jgi:hypothetical protein
MRKLVLVLAAGCLGSLLLAQSASAADSRFPTRARNFSTWMVRAFNQCTPGSLSVFGAGVPSSGCVATVSDDLPPGDPLGASMKYSRLTVRRFPGSSGGEGKIILTGRGFQPGQRIAVRLTLRTTRSSFATKHPPTVNSPITFADTTIDCGNQSAGCFGAHANGAIIGRQSLVDCLTQNGQPTGLANENVEIVAASLVNCDTTDTVAVPGILN